MLQSFTIRESRCWEVTSFYLEFKRLLQGWELSCIQSLFTLRDVDAGLTFIAKEPNPGLVVVPDQFIVANRAILIGGAAQRRLPAIYGFRNMVSEGGLMS